MKKQFCLLFPIVLFLAVFFVSCQHEESEVEEQNPENLTKSSELTSLLQRVASYDAPDDQAIDSTLCFSVKFPYAITIHDVQENGDAIDYEYAVNDEPDLVNVTGIIENLQWPADDFAIVFPITVIYPDESEVVLANQAAFDAAKAACEGNPQSSIGCININYPITIFGYNSNFQLANTYTINTDIELYTFIVNLGSDEYYAIDYPISITNANGEVITVDNNVALIAAIQDAIAACGPNVITPCPNPNILTGGLIIYMPFANEDRDLISFENAIHNDNYPPAFVADRDENSNGAISFSGNALDFLKIPVTDANQLQQGDSLTVSLWFKMQNIVQGDLEYMFQKSEGAGNNAISLGVYDGNTPLFMNDIGSGYDLWDTQWNTTAALHTDTTNWHHLVLTIDGVDNTVKLYRDGVLRNTGANPNLNISTEFFDYYLGRSFKGYLDDLRVYRRTLSAADVQTLYNLPADNNTCVN